MFNKIADLMRLMGLRDKYYFNSNSIDECFVRFKLNENDEALDIGSGKFPRNPFCANKVTGLDLSSYAENNVLMGDLGSGSLPFEDGTFEYITAFDVLEHIPRVTREGNVTNYPFVELMNEVYRVLKSDGIFYASTPCFPFSEAFQDPTHVNIMTEGTIKDYFCNDSWAGIYGFKGKFKMLKSGWINKRHFIFIRKFEYIKTQ